MRLAVLAPKHELRENRSQAFKSFGPDLSVLPRLRKPDFWCWSRASIRILGNKTSLLWFRRVTNGGLAGHKLSGPEKKIQPLVTFAGLANPIVNKATEEGALIHNQIIKENIFMKTTIIRALAIATLATSMSAFAMTEDNKSADASSPCASARQDASTQDSQGTKKEKKSRKNHKDDQKDQNSDQLLGIYG